MSESTDLERYVLKASSIMYINQHWIFVVSYLRVSVIFKLVFSFHNDAIKAELRRKEIFMFAFGCFGLLFINVPLIISLVAES